MAKNSRAKAVNQKILASMGTSNDEIVWAFIDGISTALDYAVGSTTGGYGVPLAAAGPIADVANLTWSLKDSFEPLDNPYFITNGHGIDDDSPLTKLFFKNLKNQKLFNSSVGIASTTASTWTLVDIGGSAAHSHALYTTGAHLNRLHQLSKKMRQDGTVAGWIDLAIKMKSIKMGVRKSQFTANAVPIPLVGLITDVMAVAVSSGATMTHTKACVGAALELHWRAKQEQSMASVGSRGAGSSVGPASKITWELCTKLGVGSMFGNVPIGNIINEPAGWHVINAKLISM